jgi:hypothetical protein
MSALLLRKFTIAARKKLQKLRMQFRTRWRKSHQLLLLVYGGYLFSNIIASFLPNLSVLMNNPGDSSRASDGFQALQIAGYPMRG